MHLEDSRLTQGLPQCSWILKHTWVAYMASSAMHAKEKTTKSKIFSTQHGSMFVHLCFQNIFVVACSVWNFYVSYCRKIYIPTWNPKPYGFEIMTNNPIGKSQVTCLMCCHCHYYYPFLFIWWSHSRYFSSLKNQYCSSLL